MPPQAQTDNTMNHPTPDTDHPEPQDEGPPRHLLASLRQLLATVMGMLHTRMSLAGEELEEEWQRLIGLLLGMVGLLVFGLAGILMLTLMLMLAVDATQRLPVLAGFSLLYLGLAGWFWWRIQKTLATRPPLLQATLDELAQDRDAFQAASTPDAEAETGRDAP